MAVFEWVSVRQVTTVAKVLGGPFVLSNDERKV